jgi:hypothetical protein
MRGLVLERFDMVVDGHRQHLCLVRDVAADHQDHAELTHRVRKAEDSRGHETRSGERQHHCEEGIPRIGTQRRCRLQRLLADGFEGLLQRLHDERHRVDHRSDDEASEGEGQWLQPTRRQQAAEDSIRPHQHQQVEAENRWRQHQRQRDQGADHSFRPVPRARQPPGQRRAEQEQHSGGRPGQLERQPDRREVDRVQHDSRTTAMSRCGRESGAVVTTRWASAAAPVMLTVRNRRT